MVLKTVAVPINLPGKLRQLVELRMLSALTAKLKIPSLTQLSIYVL